jgi:hypothetical protein
MEVSLLCVSSLSSPSSEAVIGMDNNNNNHYIPFFALFLSRSEAGPLVQLLRRKWSDRGHLLLLLV